MGKVKLPQIETPRRRVLPRSRNRKKPRTQVSSSVSTLPENASF